MKQKTIFEGFCFAIFITLVSIPLQMFLYLVFRSVYAWQLLVLLLSGTAMSWNLGFVEAKPVRHALTAIGCALLLGSFLLTGPCTFSLSAVFLLWLFRSITSYRSVIISCLDFGICLLSVTFFTWAMQLGGNTIAIWCFFLVQSFIACLPREIPPLLEERQKKSGSRFEEAYVQAEAALRELVQRSV